MAVGALTGTAGAAWPWEPSTPVELGPSMQRSYPIGLAVAPNGMATALWSTSADGAVARTRPAGSDTFGVQEVLGGVVAAQASGPGNRVAVATRLSAGGTNTLRIHVRTADGATFESPVQVVATTDDIDNASVALGPNGSIVVAWAAGPSGGNSFHVYARVGTISGGAVSFEPQVQLTASPCDWIKTAVAIGADGRIAVSWRARLGNSGAPYYYSLSGVQVRIRPAAGGAFGLVTNATTLAPNSLVIDHKLAYGAGNELVVAYMGQGALNSGVPYPFTVATTTMRDGQASFDMPVTVSTYNGQQGSLAMGVAGDGAITVGWIDDTATTHPRVATRAAGSATFGAAEDLIVPATGATARTLRIAVAADGAVTAGWWQQDSVGLGGIGTPYLRERPAGASTFGSAIPLGATSTYAQYSYDFYYSAMEIQMAANGDATALWSDASGGTWTPKTRASLSPPQPSAGDAGSASAAGRASEAGTGAAGAPMVQVKSLTATVGRRVVITAQVMTTADGTVRLDATTRRNRDSERRWRCTADATVRAGVTATVSCTLRKGARRQLRLGAIWLAGGFRLTTAGGAVAEAYRGLPIARSAARSS
jgi:hypothetical protein